MIARIHRPGLEQGGLKFSPRLVGLQNQPELREEGASMAEAFVRPGRGSQPEGKA